MALFQAGEINPTGTVTLTVTVPDAEWFKRALTQALFLLGSSENWDNIQGSLSVDECASLSNGMIETMVWTP